MSSIFLSHSHKDKTFVNELASDLRRSGYYVWTDDAEIKIGDSLIPDDAEIKIGDSLIQKIREGIDRVAYVGVVLSIDSINSEWVKKELDIAMNQEIEGRRVKVLPLLLDDVELPGFLIGKKYADFRDKQLYDKSIEEIKKCLDEVPTENSGYSPSDARDLIQNLNELKEQLEISQSEKEALLTRLSIERKFLDPLLVEAIESNKKEHPELEDINQNFAFLLSGIPITAEYFLHAIGKERKKGKETFKRIIKIEILALNA
jgi:hypothetical protein